MCKDASLMLTNDFIRINIIQDQGSPGFFPGLNINDLVAGKKNSTAPLRFMHSLQTMLRFNVHIEALVRVMDWPVENNSKHLSKSFVISGETKLKTFN